MTFFAYKSKGLSEESFKTPVTSDSSFVPKLTFIHNRKIEGKFKGSCLTQDTISFTHKNVTNLFILNKLDTCSPISN